MFSIKKTLIFVIVLGLISLTIAQGYAQESTNNYPPYTTTKVALNDTYTLLSETQYIQLFYKKHNGIFKVVDKRNGSSWTSGIDHDYDQYIEKTVELYAENHPDATTTELASIAQPLEEQMNNTREGIANSFLVVDMMRATDPARASTQMGSSAKAYSKQIQTDSSYAIKEIQKDSVNTDNLYLVSGDDRHFVLDVQFKAFDVRIKAHIYVLDTGFDVEIRDHEITGEDANYINYINIMPFLGAYGGKQTEYNPVTGAWDIPVLKPRQDGYVFVPDGSGALIDFKDYESSLSGYTGFVYGGDMAQYASNLQFVQSSVPTKQPLMPVFGIAYESLSKAFVSYATKGAEYMEIISRPNDSSDSYNLTNYTISFPRFLYNGRYSQVYNQAGDTYISAFEERNHFDLSINYTFLEEDPTYQGMANTYRAYLLSNNQLFLKEASLATTIPLRVDFLMADAKKSLIGTEDVVVTTIDDVDHILSDLTYLGITNINSGLYGYQKGGITLGKKTAPNYSRAIGTAADFQRVITEWKNQGVSISMAQNIAEINDVSTSLTNIANKHINGQYMVMIDPMHVDGITNRTYYVRPAKVVEYIEKQVSSIKNMGFSDITYEGYTQWLYSDTSKNQSMTDTIQRYQEVAEWIQQKYATNHVSPNQYLWAYTDRFLQTPMFNSQYIVETETVPFLQMVLHGTMELYATYANFSFYEQKDLLKMIDYNTYPSFILTQEPAYKLQKTNAQDYFSTEYAINQALIEQVYQTVSQALNPVMNATWVARTEVMPNVYMNTYNNGVSILINYQTQAVNYAGHIVTAQSYLVIGG